MNVGSKAPEVERLHAAGLTSREISTVVGITTQAVYKHLKRLGLAPNPPATGERVAS